MTGGSMKWRTNLKLNRGHLVQSQMCYPLSHISHHSLLPYPLPVFSYHGWVPCIDSHHDTGGDSADFSDGSFSDGDNSGRRRQHRTKYTRNIITEHRFLEVNRFLAMEQLSLEEENTNPLNDKPVIIVSWKQNHSPKWSEEINQSSWFVNESGNYRCSKDAV